MLNRHGKCSISLSAHLLTRQTHHIAEAPIRTLGVSLVAIAAIVASLTVVRQLQEQPERTKEKRPEIPPAAVDLDQLRNAGL
jgi:hypothetical protein